MATLPGVVLCRAFGFRELHRAEIPLPDGAVAMGPAL
jgi:hypothetical protein